MLLSAAEFDRKIAQGKLRLAFIGMSNIGKSYTAQRITKVNNFECYEVDVQIQAKLGLNGMGAVADWMGHPFQNGYAQKAAKYLSLESELSLNASHGGGNLVLDTTGSVIHIPSGDLTSLNNNYLIVYIKASISDIGTLIDRYYKYPKPTIWGDCYHKVDVKSDQDSLLACYPDLLALRAKLYAKLADITIKTADLASPDIADKDILPLIRSYLT